ncbi:class I SAM-dependent methyltransferase [Thiohalophilus sp.]|uniref:class I SAM-dependent methyltransferase n=1 Tax=Thiohalophilus sp. TaxID=3028392 RepID=UPI002ACD21A8|nr:methyltransferase domain-containing protein [Thiohalophilus sp.]MDZ7662969.1 methyltransferase domain-containing protein [Thiohalophilus sp.]
MDITPEQYDNWYHTPRGRWISTREFDLLMRLLNPTPGARLLDVGCGTGHFSRRFAQAKLKVTGLDPDPAMLDYARQQAGDIAYREGHAEALPFADQQFDYCAAVTSLCFIADPVKALQEMGRVSKHGIVLGLLNRHSLLHRQKAGRGAYAGARWDSRPDVINWLNRAGMGAVHYQMKSAIFFPRGGRLARLMEKALPGSLLWGGFLAVILRKTAPDTNVT